IQIDSNRQQLSPEEADRSSIAGASRKPLCQPTLAFAGIVIRKYVRSSGMPAGPQALVQFQTHPRIRQDVSYVSGVSAMFRHEPELLTQVSIADGNAARLARFASSSFKKCASWDCNTRGKQKFRGRIEQILLQEVDDGTFHRFRVLIAPISPGIVYCLASMC